MVVRSAEGGKGWLRVRRGIVDGRERRAVGGAAPVPL